MLSREEERCPFSACVFLLRETSSVLLLPALVSRRRDSAASMHGLPPKHSNDCGDNSAHCFQHSSLWNPSFRELLHHRESAGQQRAYPLLL